jgi:hypothetical protein
MHILDPLLDVAARSHEYTALVDGRLLEAVCFREELTERDEIRLIQHWTQLAGCPITVRYRSPQLV